MTENNVIKDEFRKLTLTELKTVIDSMTDSNPLSSIAKSVFEEKMDELYYEC